MHTILVTGGAGYVGAVLVPKLLLKGHKVRVLDLFLYAEPTLFVPNSRLEILQGDLRDLALVKRAVQGVDTIINLAAISNDPSSDLDPTLTKLVNIDATERLIDEAVRTGVDRFISASSSSVYGIKEENDVTEELCLEPLTVYSESKVAIEDYLEQHRGKMTAVSIRSATVCGYSPRMRLDLTVNILTHHAVKNKKITVFGGSQKRPNIHIEDITDLYVKMVDAPKQIIDGKCYNVCGANHTVLEIAELVKKNVGGEIPIEITETNDLRSYHISAEKIKRELGYVPKRTLGDAVKDIYNALLDGRLADTENDRYYNVRMMKKLLQAKSLKLSETEPSETAEA